jgi:tetratricopeptide (TPR) repeat protein
MLESYEDLIKLLSDVEPDGLEFSHMSFPDEDHSSTIMPGIHYGILSMYENWTPPDSIDNLDALVSHYQKLSEHYGYSVDVPGKHASDVGFRLIGEGDLEGALEVFEYSLANISQNAIAHYQVAFALRRLGRLTEALAEFEKAIELGPGTDMFDVFVRFRDEVAQELREQEGTTAP